MHHFVTILDEPTGGFVYDLTTVEAVNAELSLESSTANDATVAAQIEGNSKIIADMCGRVFAQQTVRETYRLQWSDSQFDGLNLSRFPLVQFDSITIGGSEADASTYEIDNEAGQILRTCGRWPRNSLIVMEYTGGYNLPDEAPAGLARACIEAIREQRSSQGRDLSVRDISSGENRVSYFDRTNSSAFLSGFNSSIIGNLIAPYRRFAV